ATRSQSSGRNFDPAEPTPSPRPGTDAPPVGVERLAASMHAWSPRPTAPAGATRKQSRRKKGHRLRVRATAHGRGLRHMVFMVSLAVLAPPGRKRKKTAKRKDATL